MHNCPKCNTPFETGTKFCTKCGANLEKLFIVNPVCPVCHKSYPDGTQFCESDGAKLVSADKMIPRCVICGKEYSDDTKFCPIDGGAVVPETLRGDSSHSYFHTATYQKASFGERLLASLLDSLIIGALSIPALVFYFLGIAELEDSDSAGTGVYFVLAVILYIIPLVYSFIKDGLGEGQSYGKRALNIKVVYVSDQKNCTKGGSSLRTLITAILSFFCWAGCIIEPIMVLANGDGRRLADLAAGTIVIKCKN